MFAEDQAMPNKRSLEASTTQAGAKKKRKATHPEQYATDKSAEAATAAATAAAAAAGAGNPKHEDVDTTQGQAFVGSGRQAAQGINYKEKSGPVAHDSKLIVKQEQLAENELQAVQNTKTEQPGTRRFATGCTHCGLHLQPAFDAWSAQRWHTVSDTGLVAFA